MEKGNLLKIEIYIFLVIISQLLCNFALKFGKYTNKQALQTSIRLDFEKKKKNLHWRYLQANAHFS